MRHVGKCPQILEKYLIFLKKGHFGVASQVVSRQQLLQRTSKGYWMYFDHSYIVLFNNCTNRSCHLHI